MTVYRRGRPSSATWAQVPGLIDIPQECVIEAHRIVQEANRKLGWVSYQLI